MSSPRWTDAHAVVHWVVHPEDHGRDEDMTVCWQTVTWAPRPYVDLPATCLFCIAYAERAFGWLNRP